MADKKIINKAETFKITEGNDIDFSRLGVHYDANEFDGNHQYFAHPSIDDPRFNKGIYWSGLKVDGGIDFELGYVLGHDLADSWEEWINEAKDSKYHEKPDFSRDDSNDFIIDVHGYHSVRASEHKPDVEESMPDTEAAMDGQSESDVYGIFEGLDVDARSFNAIGYSTNEPIKGSGEIKTKFTDISKRVKEEYSDEIEAMKYGDYDNLDDEAKESDFNLYVSGELVDRLDDDISNYSPEDVGELRLSIYDTSDIENQLKENETEGDGIGQMMLDLDKLRLDIIMRSREHENGHGESIRELQEWTNYHHNSIEAIERDISGVRGGMSVVEGAIRDHKTETNRRFGVVEKELSNTTDNLGIVESRVNDIENKEEEWHGFRYWLQSAHMTVQRYGGYKLAIPLAATALVTGASILDNLFSAPPIIADPSAVLTTDGKFEVGAMASDDNGLNRMETSVYDKTAGREVGSETIRSDANGTPFESFREGRPVKISSEIDAKPHIERGHEYEVRTRLYSDHSHTWNPTTWANEYRFWNPFSWGVESTPKTIDVTVEEAPSNTGNSGGNVSGNGNGGVVQPRDPTPPAPQPPAPPAPQPEPPAPAPQPEEEPRGRSGGSGG